MKGRVKMSVVGKIHSIESFGTVDGPGVRYVVFVKGCPMRCLYCHNPDTWDFSGGKEMTVDEILKDYDSCKEFHKNGGITVTGGEPLMQMDFVTELFAAAKKNGINTCLDTSGITFSREKDSLAKFEKLMEVTDLVMLDIKHIDDEEHKKLTGHSNKNILDFAKWLCEIKKPVWIRHVVVPDITMNEAYLRRLGNFLGDLNNLKALDVLPYHDMGKVKYQNLGIPYKLENTPPLDKSDAVKAKDIIMDGIKERLREKAKHQPPHTAV